MRLLRFMVLLLAQSLLLLGSSSANDEVVPDSATVVPFDFAKECRVGRFTFALEKMPLSEIVRTLKSGTIREIGDRSDADLEWAVDYTDGQNLIRFSSFGDMGGAAHDLEGVSIRPLKRGEKIDKIPFLRLPLKFEFGVLGMAFTELQVKLGNATVSDDVAWFKYAGKRPISLPSGKVLEYDVLGTLRVEVAEGKVVAFRLTRVSSS